MLYSILVAIDVLLAIGIIGLVLIQQGKGADVGAAFGSGASGTVFGARGSASFLTRVTAILVTLFFINSLVLAYLASHRPVAESVIDTVQETVGEVPGVENIVDGDEPVPTEIEAEDVPEVENLGSEAKSDDEQASPESMEEIPATTPDDVPE